MTICIVLIVLIMICVLFILRKPIWRYIQQKSYYKEITFNCGSNEQQLIEQPDGQPGGFWKNFILRIKPQPYGQPSALKNNSRECYLNSIIQAVASSDKLIKQFENIQSINSKSESLKYFIDLLKSVNESDDSYEHLCKNTDLLKNLIKLIKLTKPSQPDAFELLSALVKGIHDDFRFFELFEMPMKLKMVHKFKGLTIKDKTQYHLGLSVGLCGKYSTKPGVEIEYLIDQHFMPTNIDDDPNKTAQLFLYGKAPDVLLLHIQANKWDNIRGEMIKPEYHIKYYQEMILFLKIVEESNNDEIKNIKVKYKIKAVVQHLGTIEGGHYVTYRNWNDQWFLVNDEHVELMEFNNDICPYIMIYEKY